ncbi:MAG: sporulation protein YabP [Defluviitaleaceae bacterium]|nr:sporulation protein YabP [Defluviitaleaceae bacterium]
MSEERKISKHKLTIDQRESVSIFGVVDVISFDEEQVICETDLGVIVLKGENFHISKLNLESGVLEVFGQVNALNYENPAVVHKHGGSSRKKPSIIGKIFR